MNLDMRDHIRFQKRKHQSAIEVFRWISNVLHLLILFGLTSCAQPQPTVEVKHFTKDDGEQVYKVSVTAPEKYQVLFENEEIILDENLVGEFTVSSHDLKKGQNDLLLVCKKKRKEWEFPFVINNEYTPFEFDSKTQVSGEPEADWKLDYQLTTSSDVNVLLTIGADTLWDSLPDGKSVTGSFDLMKLLSKVNPDETPDTTLHLLAFLTNPENTLSRRITVKVSFPRLSLSCDYPSSKTGSSLEISGETSPGAKIILTSLDKDGNLGRTWSCRSLTQNVGQPKYDKYGMQISPEAGDFKIFASLANLGENEFKISAQKPYHVSTTKEISIEREMTDAERRKEYYRTATRVTAKELATNHSDYIGERVVVWGRTVEYFKSNELHCVAGGYHWIADLSGFESIPNLQGSSFSVAGVVSKEYYDFDTKSGATVHAPIVNAMYYTLGY